MSNLDDLLPPNFNASSIVAESGGGDYSPVPPNWYALTIDAASVETTKAGNGQYIEVDFVIDGPTHAGRRIRFTKFNIDHPNVDTVKIALEQFAALCKSIGIERPKNVAELVGCKVEGKIAIDAKDPRYEPKNVVKRYRKPKGSGPAVATSFNDDDIPF